MSLFSRKKSLFECNFQGEKVGLTKKCISWKGLVKAQPEKVHRCPWTRIDQKKGSATHRERYLFFLFSLLDGPNCSSIWSWYFKVWFSFPLFQISYPNADHPETLLAFSSPKLGIYDNGKFALIGTAGNDAQRTVKMNRSVCQAHYLLNETRASCLKFPQEWGFFCMLEVLTVFLLLLFKTTHLFLLTQRQVKVSWMERIVLDGIWRVPGGKKIFAIKKFIFIIIIVNESCGKSKKTGTQ